MKLAGMSVGRYVAVAVVLVGLLYWRFVSTDDGPRRILRANCSGGGSVDLDLSVYSHPWDFAQGGSVGYELTYRAKAAATIPLYDDDFSQVDRHGFVAGPYVSWHFDGVSNFSGPGPSYTYAPLPAIGHVRVFKAEAQVGSPDLHRPKPSKLDFMNMFLDPRRATKPEFEEAANCLATHEREFDHALVAMQDQIPSGLSNFYKPLRLGGVFYGPPPYTDPTYMSEVADLLSALVIPEAGGFRLYRGRAAAGVVNGHRIEFSLTKEGEIEVRKDGLLVDFDADGRGNQPGVSRSGWSFYFDANGCSGQKANCGESIEMIGQRDDLSDWFLIFRQLGPASWGQTLVPSPLEP